MIPYMKKPLILRMSMAKHNKFDTIEMSVDEVEQMIRKTTIIDQHLTNCISAMTEEQLRAVFGDEY